MLVYAWFAILLSAGVRAAFLSFVSGKISGSSVAALDSVNSLQSVPTKGLIGYIGDNSEFSETIVNEDINKFYPPSKLEKMVTKFNLWMQVPWNKIDSNNNILKVKLSGGLSIEPEVPSGLFLFGPPIDTEAIATLPDMCRMLNYAAYDPRITSVLIDIGDLHCGYAKLAELRRALDFYRQSNKTVIGYSQRANQKTLYLSLSLDALYVPPDGDVEALGFAAEAQFFGGVFNNVGVEPQVQRIGKYKSAGDTFNRTTMSEAQREVTSSLLMETSNHWARNVARTLNKTVDQVKSLWSDHGAKTPYDYKALGYITGVR